MDKFFAGRRVLLTGHTGFKGSWLLAWLEMLGAEICGISLTPPTKPALFDLIGGPKLCARHEISDIRDSAEIAAIVTDFRPQTVFHMAAQALVLPSLADPVDTFSTNVTGTASVLDACRKAGSVERILAVTSDKVYANDGGGRAFIESDRLGGHDPYSASKAASELVVDSFRASYFAGKVPLATARAGNVIGGGDWATHRVLPDAMRAMDTGGPLVLRRPGAVRPWQHVLDPLAGYLTLAARPVDGAFNFGPEAAEKRTVAELVDAFGAHFAGRPGWTVENAAIPPEAPYLTLSAGRAREELGWRPKLDFAATVAWTARWYASQRSGADALSLVRDQISEYSRIG